VLLLLLLLLLLLPEVIIALDCFGVEWGIQQRLVNVREGKRMKLAQARATMFM
jgi:hypothetical protein